jgi:tetratricopeptide (TPR) repeat protein
MKGYTNNSLSGTLRNERGSSAFTFAGYAIIVVVIIGAITLFKSGDVGKQAEDKDSVAAMNALKDKKWAEAASLFTKAIHAQPRNVSAYLGRSKAYLHMGQVDKALKDANAAIQITDSAQARGQRAVILKVQQKTEDALKDLNQAIQMDGKFAWAYAQRADLYYRLNDQEKALKDVQKALSLKPDSAPALRLKAWILSKSGKCKEAAITFQTIESRNPKDPAVMQDRAWFLLTCPDEKQQDTAKAMELAKKAFDLTQGKDSTVQETLAEAFFKQGDFLNAAKHQEKAIEIAAKKCPDGSCLKEMQGRLQKYQMAARPETRKDYEVLPMGGDL